MAKGSSRQWHVPTWWGGAPGVGTGIGNTGVDIFSVLVQGDVPSTLHPRSVPDASDEYVVERIIGQFLITANELTSQEAFLHHRIYPTISDETSVALRDLTLLDEAESDFLWHQVEPWASQWDADTWGTWQAAGNLTSVPEAGRFMGRLGHFDVRVNRRIRQGEALVWHTQVRASSVPVDDTYWLKMWVRLLVRNG